MPLVIAIGFPTIIWYVQMLGKLTPKSGQDLVPAFSFFFVALASLVPTVLASYSLVGEKVEKSLEPLLATPLTDGEILSGKMFAAFLPTLVAMYIGISIFMVGMDEVTIGTLGYYLFPNWTIEEIIFFIIPLAIIFSVEGNVIISSRVTDIRTSQGFGYALVLPFGAIYVLTETGYISFTDTTLISIASFSLSIDNLILLALVILVVDIILFYFSHIIFRREEILTRWR